MRKGITVATLSSLVRSRLQSMGKLCRWRTRRVTRPVWNLGSLSLRSDLLRRQHVLLLLHPKLLLLIKLRLGRGVVAVLLIVTVHRISVLHLDRLCLLRSKTLPIVEIAQLLQVIRIEACVSLRRVRRKSPIRRVGSLQGRSDVDVAILPLLKVVWVVSRHLALI
jgi:hypothetical protein